MKAALGRVSFGLQGMGSKVKSLTIAGLEVILVQSLARGQTKRLFRFHFHNAPKRSFSVYHLLPADEGVMGRNVL